MFGLKFIKKIIDRRSSIASNVENLAKAIKADPRLKPKKVQKEPSASPKGSRLKLPKIFPAIHTRNDPYVGEARVTPRAVSKVLTKVSSKIVRRRKDHD